MSFSDVFKNFVEVQRNSPKHTTPLKSPRASMNPDILEKSPGNQTIPFNYRNVKMLVTNLERTQADEKAIYKQLVHFNIFPIIQDYHSLNVEDLFKLCHYVKFEFFRAGTIIYRKGDPNQKKTYLIILGEVSYTIQDIQQIRQRISRQQSLEKPEQSDRKDMIPTSPKNKTQLGSPKTSDQKENKQKFEPKILTGEEPKKFSKQNSLESDYTPIHRRDLSPSNSFATLHVGQYFGIEGITSDDPRGETTIAATDCEFVVIDEQCLVRAKDHTFETEEEAYQMLMNSIPGMSFVHRGHKVIRNFEMISLDRGAVLTTQGETGQYIYVIKEGECQGYVKSIRTQNSSPRNPYEFESKDLEKCFRIKTTFENQMKLFISTPGSFVGEEILFNSDGNYNYTVKVLTASCVLFRIEKQKFLALFPREVVVGIKKIFDKKQVTNGKIFNSKVKIMGEEVTPNTLRLPIEKGESGFLSARSEASPKPFNLGLKVKSTDNSPHWSDSSSPQSNRSNKSSDEETAKGFTMKKPEGGKKSEFMKYAIRQDPEREIKAFEKIKETGHKNVNDVKNFKLKFETLEDVRSPSNRMKSPTNAGSKTNIDKSPSHVVSLAFLDRSPTNMFSRANLEKSPQNFMSLANIDRSPSHFFSNNNLEPRSPSNSNFTKIAQTLDKIPSLRGIRDEVSPVRTLNEIFDQEYKVVSPRQKNVSYIASSITLHERNPLKKKSMPPKQSQNIENTSLNNIPSLTKIPESKTIANLDLEMIPEMPTTTNGMKSPRSVKNIRKKLELKPKVVQTLSRISESNNKKP